MTVTAEVREGVYGDKVVAVEPGGAEFIPLTDRHGKPLKLFWTWMSPNLEFATVFVGVISVAFFGQTLLGASLAVVIGTGLGSITHGILSARGPHYGVPQMILSRIPFGFRGNILPAGLNALTAGIGWIAVNSVSGTFALNSLTHIPKVICLLIVFVVQISVAFFGHNLLHTFERFAFPLLALAFLLAAIIILPKASSGGAPGGGGMGGFLITLGAAFGYAAGWNPYASDYSRYFPPETNRRSVALSAGLGVFVSCSVLEILGAVSVSALPKADWAGSPTSSFTGLMPTLIADLVLLAITLGAVSANAINVYSGTMSFLALGFQLPLALRRAIVAVGFGILGFLLALAGLNDVTRYENFLLIIAYWIGPWLAVVFLDQYLRRGHHVGGFLFDRGHNPWAGWAAMLIGGAIAIWGFSNQVKYVGPFPKANSSLGDLTFEVGFVLAGILYYVFYRMQRDRTDEVMVVPD
jgi:purine-cytosine permease-like protein